MENSLATRNQHFVPRVYLKAWETQVETSREPTKKFQGVYHFDNGATVGEGSTREAILWEPHLYTINFQQLYIAQKCPLVYSYFVDAVYESMLHNLPNPVYGKLNYSIIETKQSVRKHLCQIDDWDFFYYDGTTARKKGLLNRFNDIRCYMIEDSFSKIFESKWETIMSAFISEAKVGTPIAIGLSERCISEKVAKDMLEFFFMMLCRSPHFDAMGIYTWINDTLLTPIFGKTPEVKDMMDTVWFTELYSIFYKQSGGFYHSIFAKAVENCQMILFEAYDDAGTFITSDSPAFQHISWVERINTNGYIFPMSPKFLLFIGRGSKDINIIDYRFANNDAVRYFNRIIRNHSDKTLISVEKNISILI
jgi:hypothetical protein